MGEYKNLLVEVRDRIAIITLNRPQALNALNSELLQELDHVLDKVAANDQVRCVILTGAGEKAFIAGADIKELRTYSVMQAREATRFGQRVTLKLEQLPQPSIAAVNGFALGGGCEFALACDFRIAAKHAKFGQPEVNLGITAGYGGTQRLPRLVGSGIAKELLLTGENITAERALAIGLVNHMVDAEQLLPFTLELAGKICNKGKNAVRLSKQLVNQGMQMDLDRALAYEAEVFALCFSEDEHAEGMAAFVEKRAPRF